MHLLDLTEECLAAAEGNLAPLPVGPDGKKPRARTRIQVFKNTFIERWFAQAHPITPGVWFGWLVAWGVWSGAQAFGLGVLPLFVAGFMVTTLIEYCLHRWLFHFVPKNQKERVQHFLLHGYHHEFMNDPMRLVLPPIGIWPVAAIFAGVWYALFGSYWFPIYAGTVAGYVAYDWTHYYTHYFNPKGGVGRWLKRYHMLHHHDSPNHRYGITSPLWDFVFGTYLPLNKMVRQAGRHAAAAE
jgi:sterol desaturase/sphingolipid hydroxylase (fatty acid hydroxylase superfamily)